MKVYESMALSRSGHHSMKNWVIKNLIGFQIDWDYKLILANGTKFFHLGEANHDIPLSMEYLDQIKDTAEAVVINYEDTPWDYTILNEDNKFYGKYRLSYGEKYNVDHQTRIIYIRDFYNNLTSRIKSNQRQIFTKWDEEKPHLFKTDSIFIERWKNHARACVDGKVSYLKFEDWLTNKEKRQEFLWETYRIKEVYDIKGIRGSQSSFESKGDVTNRFQEVEIPEETKELIRKDSELHYLIGKLGYDYKNI
jgi:hypothetical protein